MFYMRYARMHTYLGLHVQVDTHNRRRPLTRLEDYISLKQKNRFWLEILHLYPSG